MNENIYKTKQNYVGLFFLGERQIICDRESQLTERKSTRLEKKRKCPMPTNGLRNLSPNRGEG